MPYRLMNATRHPEARNAHALSEEKSYRNRVDAEARNKKPDTKTLYYNFLYLDK